MFHRADMDWTHTNPELYLKYNTIKGCKKAKAEAVVALVMK